MLELILNERKTKCNQMDAISGTMSPNKVNSSKLRESTWAAELWPEIKGICIFYAHTTYPIISNHKEKE